jgi:hypothetical protein
MKRTLVLCLTAALLLSTAHRAPAPITEESPTPALEQSAKPRIKHSFKPVASETPQVQTKRNPFDGAWIGTFNNNEFTLIISPPRTSVTEKSARYGTKIYQATCDGITMRWTALASCAWNFIPNPDGKTALVTLNCPGFFGIGVYNSTTIFRRGIAKLGHYLLLRVLDASKRLTRRCSEPLAAPLPPSIFIM